MADEPELMNSRSRPVFIGCGVGFVESKPFGMSKMIVIRQKLGVNVSIVVSGVDVSDVDVAIVNIVASVPIFRS